MPAQFVKLYKDQSQNELFGWLNTYSDSSNPEVTVEQWALVNKSDINLFDCYYYSDVQKSSPSTPNNYNEWIKSIEKGPKFEAHIKRLSYDFPYEHFDPKKHQNIIRQKGEIYLKIKDGNTHTGKQDLIMLTLQTPPQVSEIDKTIEFNQISLMATMEAPKPCLSYSEKMKLTEPITFEEFIKDGGIKGVLQFNSEQLKSAIIEYEQVFCHPESPLLKIIETEPING